MSGRVNIRLIKCTLLQHEKCNLKCVHLAEGEQKGGLMTFSPAATLGSFLEDDVCVQS